MTGMIILGVAMFGGIFDQVVALDFLANMLFGDTTLAWPAKIATWLAIAVTIWLTAFTALRKTARLVDASLNAIEDTAIAFNKACRCLFWGMIAGLGLRIYRWAMGKRK